MSIEEKIAKIKDKAARLAVKTATVATLMTGAGVASSCAEENRNADLNENKDKIENIEGTKTSVVFRSKQNNRYRDTENLILLENGDVLEQDVGEFYGRDKGAFLEPGDTVTYKGNKVKAVRYKDGTGKNVNFGKIGRMGKDITD